jgi:hypothetical protein
VIEFRRADGYAIALAARSRDKRGTPPYPPAARPSLTSWTALVSASVWILWLARGVVSDCRWTWQRRRVGAKTPGRVQAGLAALLQEIGSPVRAA